MNTQCHNYVGWHMLTLVYENNVCIRAEKANSAEKMTFNHRSKLHSCTCKAEMCIGSWMVVLEESNVI